MQFYKDLYIILGIQFINLKILVLSLHKKIINKQLKI